MKKKTFFLLALFCVTVALSSCTDVLQEDMLPSEEKNMDSLMTKSLGNDSLNVEGILPLEETKELKALKEKLKEMKKQRATTFASNDYDENFSSQIWAIRDLPITLYARGQGNTSNRYLSCNGANSEVTLVKSVTDNKQKFYLKILPSTSGIPYLIYSMEARTPLAVGYYNSNPNNKILYAMPNDTGSSYSASWGLIPSQSYKGYFAIESQSYLGQSDPNNMWSVFNYVVEVKNSDKVGYGQYTNKAQQEFLLKPVLAFQLDELTFDENSAVIEAGPMLEIKSTGKNESVEEKPYTIHVKESRYETSYFAEKQGNIQFNISNSTRQYQRPTVIAGQFIQSEKALYDAIYKTSSTQNIAKVLDFDIKGDAPERCLIKVTTYIKTYKVSVNYTVKAHWNDRQIQFSGTWRGTIIDTVADPQHIARFFDLNTDVEIPFPLRSKIKTTFKK